MTATLPDGFTVDDTSQATPTTQSTPATVAFPATLPAGFTPDPSHPTAGPSGSLVTDWERRLGTAGIDALAGIGATPRLITQGIDWLGNKAGVDIGADPALAGLTRSDGQQSFPDFQTLRERGFQRTGATEYVPETEPGKLVQAGLTAAAAAPFMGGARSIMPAFFGGATGELGSEMWPDHPYLGRAIGFAFGAHTASAVGNTAARTVAGVTGLGQPSTEVGQAFQRQGVTPTTSAEDAAQQWQQAAETAAAKLGPDATRAETGAALQNAVSGWKNNWQQTVDQKWTNFRSMVPGDTQVPVSGYQAALKSVNQDFGGAGQTAKALQPALGRTLQDALTADISPDGKLSWQAVQATRSRLGQLMQSSDTDVAQIAKRLYAGLSSDMANGATATSPAAAAAFQDANSYTAAGHQLLDGELPGGRRGPALNPILRADSPEKASDYAMQQVRGGGTRLSAIDIAAPGQVQNLGAGFIRQASEVSPTELGKRLATLSPEARNQLFGGPGTVGAQNVDDLVAIANKQREIQQTAAPPRFSSDAGRFVTAMEAGKAGQEIAGTPGRIAGYAAGYFGAPALPYLERQIAANRLATQVYGPRVTPFIGATRNALYQLPQTDEQSR